MFQINKQLVAIFLAMALSIASLPGFAVTAEEILEVLVNKGIISREEYEILVKGPSKAATQSEAQPAKPALAEENKNIDTVAAQPESKPKAESKAEAKVDQKSGPGVLTATFKDGVSWES